MRGILSGTFVVLAIAAYACDSFEESTVTPPADAGDEGNSVPPDGSAPSDGSVDQIASCDGEPEWATTTSAQATVTCDGASVSLLSDPKHCGRCDHSCGGETCTNGTCGERKEDDIFSVPYVVKDGVLYYARRPAGLGHEVARIDPKGTKIVLGKLDVDSGDEKEVLGLVASDALYVRTPTSLRKASLATPSDAVPAFFADLTNEISIGVITLGPGGLIYAGAPNGSRIDAVFPDGGVSPFIAPAQHPGEMRMSGARHVWLTQPFLFFAGGPSIVYVHENGSSKKIYESSDYVGGLAVDGDEAFVMRAATPAGAIMRLALPSLSTSPFLQDEFKNPFWQLVVAVDATHVYWLKSLDGLGLEAEIWKKARCGGAAVRIGRHPRANRLVPFGDRLYVGAEDGLWSIAK